MRYKHVIIESHLPGYGLTITQRLNAEAEDGWILMGPVEHIHGTLYHATFWVDYPEEDSPQ